MRIGEKDERFCSARNWKKRVILILLWPSNFFTTQSCFGFEQVKKTFNVLRESLIYIWKNHERETRVVYINNDFFNLFLEFKQISERSLYDVSN